MKNLKTYKQLFENYNDDFNNAIINNDVKKLKTMIDSGIDVNERDEKGNQCYFNNMYIQLSFSANKDDIDKYLKMLDLFLINDYELNDLMIKALERKNCYGRHEILWDDETCEYENLLDYVIEKYPEQYEKYKKTQKIKDFNL